MKALRYAAFAAVLLAAPAAAQEEAASQDPYAEAEALCGGPIGILRVSRIIEGGSMEGFLAASAAHAAWYRDHGYTENALVVLRVLGEDAAGGRILSSDRVMTLHVDPVAPPERDEAWTAFVDQYRASSEIESEDYVCMGGLGVR